MKRLLYVFALVLALPWSAAAQQLSLHIQDGRVTLDAAGVPASRILAEWARIGGTKVVGAEKITGGPVTLKLVNMPERQALDIILGNVAGFMAAERQVSAAPGASTYDRIFILATSSAPAQTASNGRNGQPASPANMAGTQRRVPPRPPNMPAPAEGEAEAEVQTETDQQEQTANTAPVFTFPAPGGAQPGNPPVFVPMNTGNAPVFGSTQPGAIAPPVITLQPNANGQPTIYNFVPNPDGSVPQTAPTTGFGVVGSPTPGMIQQPAPAPPRPPGQQ